MTAPLQKAHPDDILIVRNLADRHLYPQFEPRQMFGVSMPQRLYGRRFRVAWYAPWACRDRMWLKAHDILRPSLVRFGSELKNINEWEPEPLTLVDAIKELPSQAATSSRDYGRGYAQAIKDVLALIDSLSPEPEVQL